MSVRSDLLVALSGDPDGQPRWVRALADGDDPGYFADGGSVWTVHSGLGTLVAGIRALLLQALHPGALAGVHDFSDYRDDPIRRLNGTVQWVIILTFGSRAQVSTELRRVASLHRRVTGDYVAGDDSARRYSATAPDLADWVHLAFTDSFLACHQAMAQHPAIGGPIPGGPDAYVADWATAGRLMLVADPPTTAAALAARIDGFRARGELRADERTAEVVRFLQRAPFRGPMRPAYRVLFLAAVATLPKQYRRMLGLRRSPLPVITASRLVLRAAAVMLGRGPRTQDFARMRLARLAAAAAAAASTAETAADSAAGAAAPTASADHARPADHARHA